MPLAQTSEESGFGLDGTIIQRYFSPPPPSPAYIIALTSQFHFVNESVTISQLADELKLYPEVWALGVVDQKKRGIGVIVVSQFQAKLSVAYGREVLGKRLAKDLMIPARDFDWDTHILSVANHVEAEVTGVSNCYYLLKNDEGSFAGVFSSKDLLIEMFRAYQGELKTATNIQNSLIPETSHWEGDELKIVSWCKMAKGVGGDFYACQKVHKSHWALMLCDVSGKGLAASLVTTALAGMFSHYDQNTGFKPFIQDTNRFLLQAFKMEKYLTGIFIEYHEKEKLLTVYDMGHGHFRLVRDGVLHSFTSENPFLGFVTDLVPQPKTGVLKSGDLLVVYSDGFVEQQNKNHEEFGVKRFEKLITKHANEKLENLVEEITSQFKEFRGDQPRGDDLTLLLMRV